MCVMAGDWVQVCVMADRCKRVTWLVGAGVCDGVC
jgi:hypothetical protein